MSLSSVMRVLSMLPLLFIDMPLSAQQEGTGYCDYYVSNCIEAFDYFFSNYDLFTEIIEQDRGWDADFVYAIVAPEVATYNWLEDKIEKMMLELSYIKFRFQYIDPSTGQYQMKMSFIETLERILTQRLEGPETDRYAEFDFLIRYRGSGEEMRAERLERMQDIHWQTHYLTLFYAIMEEKYHDRVFGTNARKLMFYATAYNSGFQQSEAAIERRISIDADVAPFITVPKRFSYAQVAVEIYNLLHSADPLE